MIHKASLNGMVALTQELSNHIPEHSHFLNEETFGRTLIRRHVLPLHNKLSEEAVELHTSCAQVAQLRQWTGLTPEQIKQDEDETTYGSKVCQEAKVAIRVAMACVVILSYTGDQQCNEAASLLNMKADLLPETVVNELRAIVDSKKTKDPSTSSACKKRKHP